MFSGLGVAGGFVDEKQPQILRLRRCKKRTCSAQDDSSFIFLAFMGCLFVDTA
jgi:hypothetical protein